MESSLKPPKFERPICYFDVDDTLVSWEPNHLWAPGKVEFTDPDDNTPYWLTPMFKQIEAIKSMKRAGNTIIIWSQGGATWAEHVAQTLGISSYVDAFLSKPTWVYDDLPSSEYIPDSIRIIPK